MRGDTTFFIDEETRQRVPRMAHTGDINYDADIVGIGSAVAMETVPVIGKWSDFTGSSDPNLKTKDLFQTPDVNELRNEDAGIESDEKLPNLGIVGENISVTRRRLRLINKNFGTSN